MTRNNLDDIIISEIADDEHGEQAPVYPTLEQVQQAIEDAILDLGMEGRFADQEKRFDVKLGNVRQAMPKTDVPANVETMIKKSQQAVKARIKWVAIGLTMVIGVISWLLWDSQRRWQKEYEALLPATVAAEMITNKEVIRHRQEMVHEAVAKAMQKYQAQQPLPPTPQPTPEQQQPSREVPEEKPSKPSLLDKYTGPM